MRVLNGSSWAWAVEGRLNRSGGGCWAGLPRQAELIPLIPLPASSRHVSWTWLTQPAGVPAGGMMANRTRHPRCGTGWLFAGSTAHTTGWKASEKRFKLFFLFFLCCSPFSIYLPCYYSAQIITLGFTTTSYCLHFCLKETYIAWWPIALNYKVLAEKRFPQ